MHALRRFPASTTSHHILPLPCGRAMRRLDELMNQLESACKVVGDTALAGARSLCVLEGMHAVLCHDVCFCTREMCMGQYA